MQDRQVHMLVGGLVEVAVSIQLVFPLASEWFPCAEDDVLSPGPLDLEKLVRHWALLEPRGSAGRRVACGGHVGRRAETDE